MLIGEGSLDKADMCKAAALNDKLLFGSIFCG